MKIERRVVVPYPSRRGDPRSSRTHPNMKYRAKQRRSLPTPGGRIPQESASTPDTVPVRTRSSSDEGLGEGLPTGAHPQRTTAEEINIEREVEVVKIVEREREREQRERSHDRFQ